MIYLVSLIAGFINGFFASGAGQLIVFYLIFILKIDSHVGRSVSIAVLSISSIFSIYGYSKFITFEIDKIITIIIIAFFAGFIGSKIMNKIDSKVLNLISGLIITSLAIYGLCRWFMFIVISIISGIISGAGIGGGSIFVMLMTMFSVLDHKTAMAYNLIMFIVVGITATINNIKSKKFDKKLFLKIIIFCIIGSFIGVFFTKKVDESSLKQYFYIFILIIGIYEIISSVISIKKGKDMNKRKGD